MSGTPGRVLGPVGAGLVVLLVAAAVAAPRLTPYGPRERAGASHQRPSAEHWLGTDDLGHDLFTQLLFGARVSLSIGLGAAVLALIVGLTVALLAGWRGGTTDAALMRLVDLTLAFPFLPLVLVVATFLGRGLLTTVLMIGAVIWAQPARVLRSQVLKVTAYGHVEAAHGMGASTGRLLVRHVLPRLAPLAAAQFVRAANVAITLEAALSFLGLGDPARLSWGSTLFFANASNAILTEAWRWWILPPGLALTVTVLGLALVGYALEERGDRRLAAAGSVTRRRWRVATDGDGTAHAGSPPAGDVALELRGLRVHHAADATDPVRAVDGVDLTVRRGQLIGLVGESGCGKTTLAMTVLGLLPDRARVVGGQVWLDGRELTGLPPGQVARMRGRTVSLVPQSAMNALNPAYTVQRQIREAAALTREDPDARTRALLEQVGLDAAVGRGYPHELSGGMRQRVAIAMALANDPVLIVADEPLTGLDVVTQARIVRLLLDVQRDTGVAVLLVSHDLRLVGRIADDVAVMYAGRLVEHGPAAPLLTRPRHPYTRELLRASPQLRGTATITGLPGQPPDLRCPPRGCAFHPRCPDALERCRDELPAVLPTLDDGRRCACVRVEP